MNGHKYVIPSILVFLLIIPLKVFSITNFPSRIKVSYYGMIDKYGWSIYSKNYVTEEASGRAFCTSFWNLAPLNAECTKINWSENANNNIKASAAIGYIINSIRNDNATISNDNYFYGEIAINKFLYDIFKNKVNNVESVPNEVLKKINSYVKNATNIYNIYYNNDDIAMTELKFNGKQIKLDNSVKRYNSSSLEFSPSGKYIIKSTMKCMDLGSNAGSKQIECDLPKSNGKLWVDGLSYEINDNSIKQVTYSGNYVIITYDITNFVNSHSGKNIIVELNFSNRRLHHYAQRYDCGGNNQTITPNYLKTDYSDLKYRTIVFTLVPNSSIPKTCEEQITTNPIDNATLYNNHKNNDNYGVHLLDIDNPSCDSGINSYSSSCEKTTIYNEWEQIFNINGVNSNGLCTANFNFDNLVKDKLSAAKGDLIFNPADKDNAFGKAVINLSCSIPENSTGNSGNIQFNNLLPKLSLNIFNEDVQFVPVIESKIGNSDGVCEVNNSTVSCNYSGNKFSFTIDVLYKYNNDRRYFDVDDKIEVNSTSHSVENLYGYGVKVPNDIDDISGKANLIFDLKNTVFQDADNNLNTTCSYDIVDEDIRKNLLFRTIDVSKPFNTKEGNTRFTGSNWCGTEAIASDIIQHSEDIVGIENIGEINHGCIYDGDLNGNGVWDEDDVLMYQEYFANFISLTDEQINRADIDGKDGILITDTMVLQWIIAYHNKNLIGDINMDSNIDTTDLELLKKIVNGEITPDVLRKKIANIDNADGTCTVNGDDVTALERYLKRNAIDENQQDINESAEMDNNFSDSLKENVKEQYCNWNNNTVQKYILNKPNSNSKDEPLYSFQLTASDIKEIREYNKNKSYNESKKNDDGSREFVKDIYSNSRYAAGGTCKDNIIKNGICKSLAEGGA